MTLAEIAVEERPDGFFVMLMVDGKTEWERGPMDEDAATLLAQVVGQKAAEGPGARIVPMTGEGQLKS